jgi:hypothetical protein
MEARVKPAHNLECAARIPVTYAIVKQPTLRHPYSLVGAGSAAFPFFRSAAPKEPRARGSQGSKRTQRASTPRDIEACRSPLFRKSAQSQGVPRAVFLRLAPRRSPVVERLGALQLLSTVEDQAICGRFSSDENPGHTGRQGPRRNADAPGTSRLGPPGLAPHLRCKSFPGHRSPPRVWRR